jgi:tetratricopeptide (TPR) repeat protein
MRAFLLSVVCIALLMPLYAQSGGDLRESFNEGEFFFTRAEYVEAAYYFRQLVDHNPANSHYNFRLGECYMSIPGRETQAIPYFEKATSKTVAKNQYNRKSFEETSAPWHAWFYLGNVYRIAGRLDDALDAYNAFVNNTPMYYGSYNVNVVENEIKSCERAKILMDSPVDVTFELLDSAINTSASELYPAVDAAEKNLVFVRRLKFYDAIFHAVKDGDSWRSPVNLNAQIGSDGDYYPVSLSSDGNELYLMKVSGINKDLYVSYYRNGAWTKAESLGKPVNSAADETWACISTDKQVLWFASSRKGGYGGSDLYYSKRKGDTWGKPKNAGRIINTPFDEESPCLVDHDSILLFSSKGHYGMGGYDIFYTSVSGKVWKTPVNLGFPVNNTSDNFGYSTAVGEIGYISRIPDQDKLGSEDIFRIVFRFNHPLP